MQNPLTERFLEAFDLLLKRGAVTSQEEFAKALGFHPNYMALFRQGKMQVRAEHLQNLLNKFGVNLQYIFTGKGYIMQNEKLPERYEVIQKRLKEVEAILSVQEKIILSKDEEINYYKALLRLEREKGSSSRK